MGYREVGDLAKWADPLLPGTPERSGTSGLEYTTLAQSSTLSLTPPSQTALPVSSYVHHSLFGLLTALDFLSLLTALIPCGHTSAPSSHFRATRLLLSYTSILKPRQTRIEASLILKEAYKITKITIKLSFCLSKDLRSRLKLPEEGEGF